MNACIAGLCAVFLLCFHSQQTCVDLGGRVCVNMHTWPLSVFISISPMPASVYRYQQHIINAHSIFAPASLPAFMGEKLLNVGNAIKRN